MRLESYPKVLSIGDPLLEKLFAGEVVVEEKIDGSQFRAWFDAEGNAFFGSKGVNYNDYNPPDQMFVPAIAAAESHFAGRELKNAFFVFEFLAKPKQNTLEYGRVPKDNLVLLDVNEQGKWVTLERKAKLASEYGFECVPVLYKGAIKSAEELKHLLETQSFLGGTTVEGIVIKNYSQYHEVSFLLGMPLFGKYVREEFKELNRENWGAGQSMDEKIMKNFPNEPRWAKAVQHLRERGELGNGVKDIGKLISEVERDFREECKETAKELLWHEYEHQLVSSARRGFAEWYKQKLAEEAFTQQVTTGNSLQQTEKQANAK